MTDADLATAFDFHNPQQLLQAWRATCLLSQQVTAPSDLVRTYTFAAHSGCIDRAVGHRWLAVGDALIGFDPLTSSGIAGALSDAAAAVPVIQAQLVGNVAPARAYAQRADSTFRRYLQERRQRYGAESRWSSQPFWQRRSVATVEPGRADGRSQAT
jgi:2-polyprenyl-6-methoxyphenol hydroxylase-like FAD-dependent oxidoreductase